MFKNGLIDVFETLNIDLFDLVSPFVGIIDCVYILGGQFSMVNDVAPSADDVRARA